MVISKHYIKKLEKRLTKTGYNPVILFVIPVESTQVCHEEVLKKYVKKRLLFFSETSLNERYFLEDEKGRRTILMTDFGAYNKEIEGLPGIT